MADMRVKKPNHVQTRTCTLPASLEATLEVVEGTLVAEDDPGNAGVVIVSEFGELTEDPADDNREALLLLPVDEADTLEGVCMLSATDAAHHDFYDWKRRTLPDSAPPRTDIKLSQ
jgi:hypothetical protein